MSTAERLAEALEAVLSAVRFSNHPPDTVMAAEAKLEAVRKAGEQAREALAAYHSSGGQGVTPLSDEQIDQVSVTARFLGLHRAPLKAIRAFARSIERHHRIGTPASTGGEDRG